MFSFAIAPKDKIVAGVSCKCTTERMRHLKCEQSCVRITFLILSSNGVQLLIVGKLRPKGRGPLERMSISDESLDAADRLPGVFRHAHTKAWENDVSHLSS